MRNLIVGERIRLTAVKDTDLPVIEDWFNNTRFLRYYDMLPAIPMSRKQVADMIKGFEDSNERYLFAARMIESDIIVGIVGFDEIIWSNGVATVFIGIGDEKFRGNGLGTETLQLLLDYGFNELNFYRIQLNVIAYNEAAIKLYERLGFVREGVYRELILRDGKRYDLYLYGLLRHEFRSR